MNMLPKIRPAPPRDVFSNELLKNGIRESVALIGKRGWYAEEENERGIYDDAIFLNSPSGIMMFNANTDPSRYGLNPKIGKGLACLEAGKWYYKLGKHKEIYPALTQARPVTIKRDGGLEENGFFGINIHPGSYTSTSSEGCQTLWPDQWHGFIQMVICELKRYQQETIPYLLS